MANLQIIRELLEKKHITIRRFAGLIGITEQGVHRIIKTGSTKVDTLEKIAQVLEVHPASFFVDGSDTLLEGVSQQELGDISKDVFAQELADMFRRGDIYAAVVVQEKDAEIRRLSKENGRLEATIEQLRKA